jgi:hypothetical protein
MCDHCLYHGSRRILYKLLRILPVVKVVTLLNYTQRIAFNNIYYLPDSVSLPFLYHNAGNEKNNVAASKAFTHFTT